MPCTISGTGHFLPGDPVYNDQLPKELDSSDEWIRSHTGIESRYLVEPGTPCSELAYQAAVQALAEAKCNAEDLDLILVSTVTPDYQGFPSTAAILQERLGAKRAGAMDLNAACSGFIYGLETAYAFIEAGRYKKVLVIGSEVLSSISDWTDRSTCVLFGDGAGAVVVEHSEDAMAWQSSLHARGSGAEALIRRTGGSRYPFKENDEVTKEHFLRMDGKKVYLFAVEVMGKVIEELCKKEGLEPSELDHIIPHQANQRIIEAVAARKKIPMDRFRMTIAETGNTSSASIPITLDKMVRQGKIQRGETVLMVGFGAGLTYGGTLLRW